MANTKQQGAKGVAMAIAYFLQNDYVVSLPIADVQRYDLIADKDNELLKIEVKTTSYKREGKYQVQLATCGGNQSGQGKIKTLDSKECDFVFIWCEDSTSYLFPSFILEGKRNMILSPDKDQYKINAS